ncbi:MAG: YncE family protein [Melioribacteraceae bacterium]|nr:YncE family protein [Melioribacteraceae bacterium]
MKKSNNYISALFILLSLSLLLTNCTLVESDNQNKAINYEYETEAVANILNGTCASSGCHSGSTPSDGLSTEIQSDIMSGAFKRPYQNGLYYSGDVVIPYNVEKSLIMQFVKGKIQSPTSYNHKILSSGQIATLSKWIGDGAKNYKDEVPFETPSSYRVYVCNSASENISTIDGTKKVVSSIKSLNDDTTFEDTPYWVEEYGDYYYVTLSTSNKFIKIRKSDNSVVASLSGIANAGIIKINSNGTRAYISHASTSTTTNNSIYIINTTDMTLHKEIVFSLNGFYHGLALDKNRKLLYVADANNNIIYIINTQNNLVINARFSLTTNYYPVFIEVSQDGNYLYASAKNTNELLVLNAGSQALVSRISLLLNPMGISISKNGDKIYVASNGSNSIDVITKSGNFWSKTNTISHPTMSMPFAIDITNDDSYLYVTNQNLSGAFVPTYKVIGEENISTISIINTATESVEKVIEVEEEAYGIVVEKL